MEHAITKPRTAPATRTEVLDAVGHTFDARPPRRDDLVVAATESNARPELIELLRSLPRTQAFERRTDLWSHMPELPVE